VEVAELQEEGGGEVLEEEDVFCQVTAEEAAVLEGEGVWEGGDGTGEGFSSRLGASG